jgi:hypothetical protein
LARFAALVTEKDSRKGIQTCGKSLRCSAGIARTATTQRQKTKRNTPNGWKRRSSATRAASRLRTRK